MPLLTVDNLSIAFRGDGAATTVVEGASFTVEKGEVVAIIGESGSGKSVTALSLMRLLPGSASCPMGTIAFDGQDILTLPERQLRQLRGSKIAMIFQEPMTSLNPLHTIGKQIGEVLQLHSPLSAKDITRRIEELLDLVQLGGLKTRLGAYPYELSGGQRQRVMIAMALACDPALLIADEPTTALDVTVQTEILKLLKKIQVEKQMAMLFISHDLNVVRKIATRLCVMYQGKIVEQGTVEEVFSQPRHPYTQHLLAAQPSGAPVPYRADAPSILRAANINVSFAAGKRFFGKPPMTQVLKDVSFSLKEGHTLGIVGESGSGKSTLAMAILRLVKAEGSIVFMGKQLDKLAQGAIRQLRSDLQIVFQDPFASLNPRMSITEIIGEGLRAHRTEFSSANRDKLIDEVLAEVGLESAMKSRYPHEFSGGQRQRVAIARALILRPRLIIFDEPTSALDISVQAQIIDLLRQLQRKHTLSMIFISHDLRVIRALSHEIIVLKDGVIIEQGQAEAILGSPQTGYTQLLVKNSLAE